MQISSLWVILVPCSIRRIYFSKPTGFEMPVSTENSKVIYDALKACGVRLVSALPET